MRILHAISNRWNSAITEYALSATRSLLQLHHDCLLVVQRGSPAEARGIEHQIPTHSLEGFSIRDAAFFLRLSDSYRPDVVVCYGGPEMVLANLLNLASRVPYIRFRGQALGHQGLFGQVKQKWSHRGVSQIITPSYAMADQLRKLYGDHMISPIALGCDQAYYAPTSPKSDDLEKDIYYGRPEILLVGRLDPVKGHHEAFKIFAKILSSWTGQLPLPYLHVVGQPANLSAKQLLDDASSRGLKINSDVKFSLKRIPQLPQLMHSAAMGLISSLDSEIICRVAEEFLLCGTPIAISGVGSLEEVLIHPSFGVSYRGLNIDSTSKLLSSYVAKSFAEPYENKVNRSTLARQEFSFESMGQKLMATLAKCL